jgi:alpha-mannosidase
LQAFLVADDNLEQKSYLQLPEGLMLSAANIDNGKMIVRLFNASGKKGKKQIMLGVAAESVCEADLLGNQTNALKLKREGGGKTSVSVDMAQFGIKTLEIKLKQN